MSNFTVFKFDVNTVHVHVFCKFTFWCRHKLVWSYRSTRVTENRRMDISDVRKTEAMCMSRKGNNKVRQLIDDQQVK